MENIIEVSGLRKKFPEVIAVKDINFNVKKGELFGFLGPNGAGKSTTIQMLCTLLKPSAGKAIVNGYNTLDNPGKVRKSIGLVFQESTLDENLTAYENLKYHANFYGVEKQKAKKRITEVLEMVQLTERKNSIVENFSGGMKRRLEIARGLLHYPKILFLDEPTIGLDPQTRNKIWDFIQNLKKEEDITIFLTTHYMDEAEYCDRIAIMDHGEIIASDSPEQLKANLGGDIIKTKVENKDEVKKEIANKYNVEVQEYKEYLTFEHNNGEEFIPVFVKDFKEQIKSITMQQPTLDDVFLNLTGREIRDEEASATDKMKNKMKKRGH